MDTKADLEDRLDTYLRVSKILKNYYGFCSAFMKITNDRFLSLDQYPELMAFKPKGWWKNNTGFWFVPNNAGDLNIRNCVLYGVSHANKTNTGYMRRRNILNKAIKLCKTKLERYEPNNK